MPVYLLRHTTPNIDNAFCYGQTDVDVSGTFEEEFKNIIPKVDTLKIEKIYSSPLQRSAKLAEKIAERLRVKAIRDGRLKELNYGQWELMKWSDILPTELNIWMQDFVNLRTPCGESYNQLYQRVNEFINSNDLNNALIISHAGTMRSILCSLMNVPLNDSFKKFKIGYHQVYEIDPANHSCKVLDIQ